MSVDTSYNIRDIILETSKTSAQNILARWHQISTRNEAFMKKYEEDNKRAANQMGFQSITHIVSTFLNFGAGLFGTQSLFGENIQKFAQNAPTMISSFSQIFTSFMEKQRTLHDGNKNIAQINKNDGSSQRQLNEQLLKELQDTALRLLQSLHMQQ